MNYEVKVSTNKVEKTQSVKMYYYGITSLVHCPNSDSNMEIIIIAQNALHQNSFCRMRIFII